MSENREYVKKAEVKPWRAMFHEWMEIIRSEIKEKGITYEYHLVGSSRRNLVIRHHNKGFDCDYQLMIMHNSKQKEGKDIKESFMHTLDKVVTNDGFKNCKDSTSSIEIEMVDSDNSKIIAKYDIAILVVKSDQMEILRHYKTKPEVWTFEILADMTKAHERYKKIVGNQMWRYLRDVYYDKKTANKEENKKSFQILNEAVVDTLKHFGCFEE